jgi:hypothetical protein
LYHAPKREFLPTTFFQFKTGLVLFFMAWLTGAFGQTVMKYVPANADVAITFNLQNLEKKVNLDQLKQYDFYQAVVKEFTQTSEVEGREHEKNYYEELLREPTNLGFDLMEPFYFFIKKEGNNTHLTLVMKLSDTAKFETGLQNLKQESYFAYLEEKEGYHLWQQDKQIFAWNDEVVLFVWTEALPDPSYDPGLEIPPYEESEGYEDIAIEEPVEILEEDTIPHPEEPVEIMEVPAIEEEMAEETLPPAEDSLFFDWSMDTLATDWSFFEKNVAAAEWADKVMKRSFLQPLSANQRYLSAISQPADVHLWMDYSFFIESMKSGNPGIAAMGMANEYAQAMNMMTGFLEVLYSDAYLSLDLNFEKGKMAMRSSMYFNEDMKKFYQGMFDVKFNKKLLRYVKGSDQLFGYFYVHYNIEKTIAEGKNLLYKLFDATPQYGEMAADAMQILGIIIDEEAIGEVMKGDLLVSISGLQTVEVTTQTYEFDAEFNYVEKDTTMMKTLPVMTVLASYGSEKDVRKFINLGLHSKVLAAEGRHYKMTVPETGMDFYLALQDGVLILTNNRYLVHQNLEKGFDKKLRLDKKHRKLLCDNASVLYWDIPNTMRALAGDQAGSNAGAMGYMNSLGKEFESFLMTTAKKPENSLRGQMDFNFVKKDVNALQQFFNFVNDIYLEYIGGAKI